MSASSVPEDTRAAALQAWLAQRPGCFEGLQLLRADASFRRYFRARRDGEPVVIMDAPPEREPVAPFLRIARLLEALGQRPPRIHDEDPDAGFLVLEDLGDRTFTRALAEGEDEKALYQRAIDRLADLHRAWPQRPAEATPALPAYDTPRLLDEARLFIDWYVPEQQGHPPTEAARGAWETAWTQTLDALPHLEPTLVLRDFHVDNLMIPPEGTGCALLDFQDAVLGSPAYDVVSLLEDARRDVSPAVAREALARYLQATGWPDEAFRVHYRVLGVQRAIKILGIFTRLHRRDGKPDYRRHEPRLQTLVRRGLAHPDLQPVAQWFRRHLPGDPATPEPAPEARA
ncbi:aminoglycoside phosphotransferase family protein [Thioalkalivibrio sp. AKL17]|uniref:aminoglycoside phosphotransferase family protein n=1 Tax=Thioalkalivibrio sp. AKL17 TaxID=1158160 RepID=UPI00035D0102|nr:phosphotransferase [Thioalkalivibrio sp. AKL17]